MLLLEKWVYISVVLLLLCPKISWIYLKSVPLSESVWLGYKDSMADRKVPPKADQPLIASVDFPWNVIHSFLFRLLVMRSATGGQVTPEAHRSNNGRAALSRLRLKLILARLWRCVILIEKSYTYIMNSEGVEFKNHGRVQHSLVRLKRTEG